MHKVTKRLFWIVFVSLVMGPGTAASLTDSTAMAAPVSGGLIADSANPSRLKHFNGGPAFIASVGEPEGFLYRGTKNANGTRSGDQAAIINELQARGINCLFVIGFNDSRYGGDGPADGNPFVNANISGNIDADILNQWYSWFQTLDAAGIVVILQHPRRPDRCSCREENELGPERRQSASSGAEIRRRGGQQIQDAQKSDMGGQREREQDLSRHLRSAMEEDRGEDTLDRYLPASRYRSASWPRRIRTSLPTQA